MDASSTHNLQVKPLCLCCLVSRLLVVDDRYYYLAKTLSNLEFRAAANVYSSCGKVFRRICGAKGGVADPFGVAVQKQQDATDIRTL